MSQNYKIRNMLKNLPKKRKLKKTSKNLQMLDFYLSYYSFLKNLKD